MMGAIVWNQESYTRLIRILLAISKIRNAMPIVQMKSGFAVTDKVLASINGWLCSPLQFAAINYWDHVHDMEDQSMIIGERLRALREENSFHRRH